MTEPTHLLTVLISDRRGIVASISAALAALEIELIELTQTVVSGHFTITLVLAIPERSELAASLANRIVEQLGGDAAATLLPYKPHALSPEGVDRYILTASGEARTSVIQALSHLIAERGGNFVELNCQVHDKQLSIMAEIEFPADVALDQLQIDLQHLAKPETMRVRLQHQRLFTATNEIAFRRVGA